MTKDAIVAVKPAAWEVIAPDEEAAKQLWFYPYRNARALDLPDLSGGFRMYNVIGTQTQLEALLAQFDPVDVYWNMAWEQGPGVDSFDWWVTDPTVLENDIGVDPATINHRFTGQSDRIYAGDFSDDFSEDFL